MSNYFMVIDGGTTNTRFTLIKDSVTIEYITKKIGASDTKDSSRNFQLEQAVREAIEHMEKTHNCRIDTILASGMITSNVGLLEIAHLKAPVDLNQLAASIKPCKLTDVSPNATFYFVPGIKFIGEDSCCKDILRGEETEIYGAIEPEEQDKTILFIHFGSHNKIVQYRDKSIVNSVTTISGELFWAIINNTILKSSVTITDEFEIDPKYVLKGYLASENLDFTRSLFMARINQVMGDTTKEQTLSYILGVLMYSDLKAFSELLQGKTDKIVLYGRDQFIKAFLVCLKEFYGSLQDKAEVISYKDSEKLSIKGLIKIHNDIHKDGTCLNESYL